MPRAAEKDSVEAGAKQAQDATHAEGEREERRRAKPTEASWTIGSGKALGEVPGCFLNKWEHSGYVCVQGA